jgi:hypothetical protein
MSVHGWEIQYKKWKSLKNWSNFGNEKFHKSNEITIKYISSRQDRAEEISGIKDKIKEKLHSTSKKENNKK